MVETRTAWLRHSARLAGVPGLLPVPGRAAAQTAPAPAGAIHALVFPTWDATPDTLRHAVRERMAVDISRARLKPPIDTAARFGELSAPFPARDLLAG